MMSRMLSWGRCGECCGGAGVVNDLVNVVVGQVL